MKNEVYLIDNMEFMKDIPDNYYELAIVDPPYGIGGDALHSNRALKGCGKLKNRAINMFQTKWDIAPSDNYFTELKRISKNQIIWGGNYFNLGRARGFICWDKCQPWENFSQVEFAWSSFEKPAKLYKYDNKRDHSRRIHPTQKPVALYKWLLTNYAKPNDKIFDSHVGSGSSRIAAYELGFHFEGCELDKDYWKAQEKRFKKEKARIDNEFYISEDEKTLFNLGDNK
jgi:site-specific DNA-methyltransferase (adenine-specific)